MIHKAIKHEQLPVYGDGKQIRDWIFVRDHCVAIDEIFEKGKLGEVYNIGGHCERKNIDVVKKIIQIVSESCKDSAINENLISYVRDRPGHDRRYAINTKKIENEIGWKPSINFEDGLKKTIQWYLNNKEWLENITNKSYIKTNKKLVKTFEKK